MLIAAAVLCTVAAVIPVAARRRGARPQPVAHAAAPGYAAARNGVARSSAPVRPTVNGELMDGVVSATRDVVAARPPRPARPPASRDEAILRYAAARRRGLLASHGRGKARGELTPKAFELLGERAAAVSALERVERAPADEPAVSGLREDLPVLEHDRSA